MLIRRGEREKEMMIDNRCCRRGGGGSGDGGVTHPRMSYMVDNNGRGLNCARLCIKSNETGVLMTF